MFDDLWQYNCFHFHADLDLHHAHDCIDAHRQIEFDPTGDSFTNVDPANTLVLPGDARSTLSPLLAPGVYFARVSAANAAGSREYYFLYLSLRSNLLAL